MSKHRTTVPRDILGPKKLGMFGNNVACWHVLVFKYHPAPMSHPVHVAYEVLQSRQLAIVHVTTMPVAVFGPLVLGKLGAIVACSQVVPSKYQPVPVSHPVHVK